LLAASLLAVSGLSATPAAADSTRGPAVIIGDSLTQQAQDAIRFLYAVRTGQAPNVGAWGGTSLCNWVDNITQAVAESNPSLVVLEFVGNNLAECSGNFPVDSDQYIANSADSMDRAFGAARSGGATVIWVRPPTTADPASNARFDRFAQMAADRGAAVLDVGDAIAPGHQFVPTMPCLPSETADLGCDENGQIRVRADDGAHFYSPGATYPSGVPTGGQGYSSGAFRYATALVGAITYGLPDPAAPKPKARALRRPRRVKFAH
jgi:hypothetical protein